MENTTSDISRRLDAVNFLIDKFKMERFLYLSVTLISCFVLIASAVIMIVKGQAGWKELGTMFSSSGTITITIGRILRMFDVAVKFLGGGKI